MLAATRDSLAPDARIVVDSNALVWRGLCRVSEREHRDLLVVGSSRRAGDGQVRLGERAQDLLYHLECPLAVAPRGTSKRMMSRGSSGSASDSTTGPKHWGPRVGRVGRAGSRSSARGARRHRRPCPWRARSQARRPQRRCRRGQADQLALAAGSRRLSSHGRRCAGRCNARRPQQALKERVALDYAARAPVARALSIGGAR
jgi:hypothetical protein